MPVCNTCNQDEVSGQVTNRSYSYHIEYEYQDIASQGKRGSKCEKRNVERLKW